MKKIILFIILGLTFSVSSSYAASNILQTKEAALLQREVKVASRAAVVTKAQVNILQDLRQRAQTEITRRLSFLNDLITKLNSVKKISSLEKTDLQSQIQTQIDGLNALQTKINNDTDNTILRADVKSIIGNYYIYLFFRVKVNLLIAADKTSMTSDSMSVIYAKLQTRVNQAQTAGDDVTTFNSLLSDINAKITDANTQIGAALAELTPLTAQGYPGNKVTLTDAKTKIKTAVTDLKTAYEDAMQIRSDLKGLKIKNPQASESAH